MKAKELLEILKTLDEELLELPIATSAMGNVYFSANEQYHGKLKVSLVNYSFAGVHILIGDQYKKNPSGSNWCIIKDIYGKTQE